MTNTIRNLTLAALAIAAALSTTQANAAGYHVERSAQTTNIAYNDVLNARAWPATSSRIKFGIRNTRTVHVHRCIIKSGTDWCLIRRGGRTGWVNGRYIKRFGQNFATPHPAAYGWH